MEQTTKTYEAMFLLGEGNSNLETACEPIRDVLGRSDAEILSIKPWEERRLAYQIMGQKRGLYVLVYFNMDPQKVVEMERDCRLNEKIHRVLVLRKDHLTDKEINSETTATIASARRDSEDKPAAKPPETEETPAPEVSSEPEAVKVDDSASDVPGEVTAPEAPLEVQENNHAQESPDPSQKDDEKEA